MKKGKFKQRLTNSLQNFVVNFPRLHTTTTPSVQNISLDDIGTVFYFIIFYNQVKISFNKKNCIRFSIGSVQTSSKFNSESVSQLPLIANNKELGGFVR